MRKALWDLSYGLYIVTSKSVDNKYNGQIVNTAFQVTSTPPQIAVCISKENLTHKYIEESKIFGVSVLEKETPMLFIGKWGFKSGKNINKFDDETTYKEGTLKTPLVTNHSLSIMEAKVTSSQDLGTHTLFIGEVVSSEIIKDGEILTYEYYQNNKKGKAPKTAPTYKEKN